MFTPATEKEGYGFFRAIAKHLQHARILKFALMINYDYLAENKYSHNWRHYNSA